MKQFHFSNVSKWYLKPTRISKSPFSLTTSKMKEATKCILIFLHFTWVTNGDNCPMPKIERNQMLRITPNSKYLHPANLNYKVALDRERSLCQGAGLEVANIETIADYWHITNDLVKAKNMWGGEEYVKITLGGRSSDKRHIFNSVNTGTRLPIELFNFWVTMGGIGKCLTLTCDNDSKVCYFRTSFCHLPGTLLCQYKKGTPCYDNTPAAQHERKQDDIMVKLGNSGKRAYYGSVKQKTWEEAMDFCQWMGYSLLDFEKDDKEELADLWGDIGETYKKGIPIPEYASFSWTAGRYSGKYGREKKFRWETSGKQWSYEDGARIWSWLPDSFYKDDHQCIALLRNNETNQFSARLMVCDEQSLFVCYKEEIEESGEGSSSRESGSEEEDEDGYEKKMEKRRKDKKRKKKDESYEEEEVKQKKDKKKRRKEDESYEEDVEEKKQKKNKKKDESYEEEVEKKPKKKNKKKDDSYEEEEKMQKKNNKKKDDSYEEEVEKKPKKKNKKKDDSYEEEEKEKKQKKNNKKKKDDSYEEEMEEKKPTKNKKKGDSNGEEEVEKKPKKKNKKKDDSNEEDHKKDSKRISTKKPKQRKEKEESSEEEEEVTTKKPKNSKGKKTSG